MLTLMLQRRHLYLPSARAYFDSSVLRSRPVILLVSLTVRIVSLVKVGASSARLLFDM